MLSERNHFESISDSNLTNFPILTKEGRLKAVSNLFFGAKFKPFINIENHIEEDIFVSEEYLEAKDTISDWKAFSKR